VVAEREHENDDPTDNYTDREQRPYEREMKPPRRGRASSSGSSAPSLYIVDGTEGHK
jgi:hypothetical protein